MVHELQNLDRYIKLCGSRYAATLFVGKKARELAEKYDNLISHAEALSWLLSGSVPNNVIHYRELYELRERRYFQFAQDYLSGILDEKVKEAVNKSLEKSRSKGHLIYSYEEVYDKERQSRVRILVNKLWYEYQELE